MYNPRAGNAIQAVKMLYDESNENSYVKFMGGKLVGSLAERLEFTHNLYALKEVQAIKIRVTKVVGASSVAIKGLYLY